MNINYLRLFIIFIFYISMSNASIGDNSEEFLECFYACHFNNCISDSSLNSFLTNQGLFDKLLFWSCEDECKYECMWNATSIYLERGWRVPQFYGKWPFFRFLGLQEPASVLFSFLNFLGYFYNYKKIRKNIPSNAPLYDLWKIYYMICMNAWTWSFVFHARDTPLFERLDYFSAFSMVLASFLMLAIRTSGRRHQDKKAYFFIGFSLFFAFHVWYLSSKRFDYGYNMNVNIIVGLLNGSGWIWWAVTRKPSRTYLYWCNATFFSLGVAMFLELFDFPPILWVFDAHALWHLSTLVVPFFWYKFVEGDCFYLWQNAPLSKPFLKKCLYIVIFEYPILFFLYT